VEQSYDGGQTWSSRGTLSFKNSKNYRLADSKKLGASTRFEQKEADVSLLNKLAESNGVYFIRIKPQNPTGNFLLSSAPACSVVSSNLVDSLVVHLDTNGYSKIIGIDYFPNKYECTSKELTATEYKTKVSLGFPSKGSSPIMSALQSQQEVEQPQQESFFSRYWMWIVGVGAFLVLSNLISVPDEGSKQKKKE